VSDELISVIVPVYNVEQYLETCIDSIQKQTYSHLEIILVDDKSTNGCEKLCDEYAAIDHRVKVFHLSDNMGVSAARNIGVEKSAGGVPGPIAGLKG